MAELVNEYELVYINKLKKIMKEQQITYNEILKSKNIEIELRTWFNTRKQYLLNGSLSDEDINIFVDSGFDFGINYRRNKR